MAANADIFDYHRALMASYMQANACFRLYVTLSAINDYLQVENAGEGLDENGSVIVDIMQAVMMSVQKGGMLSDMTFIRDWSEENQAILDPLSEEEIKKFIDQIGGTPTAEKDKDD